MTIAKTGSENSYAGDDVSVNFAFLFRFFDDTDLQVYIVASDGTSTLQTLTTNYSVVNTGTESGGTVTMVVAPATGETLLIQREVPEMQSVDYQNNDAFPAETHEQALDRLTLLVQQQSRGDAQHITYPTGDTASATLPTLSNRAEKLFGFDSSGGILMYDQTSGVYATYDTRADFVTAVAGGLSVADGGIIAAAGIFYIAEIGDTSIGDLPGFKHLATMYMSNADGQTNRTAVFDTDATAGGIEKVNDSGAAAVVLRPSPSDGTSIAQVTMFRDTSTTGEVRVTGYRGDGTADNPFFEFSTTDNNYVGALGASKTGPHFTIGAEGAINTYKNLISRIDFEDTDGTDVNNRLMEIAADGDHGTHWGPIVDLIRGGNPSNVLTADVNTPSDGDPLGVLRFTGRDSAFGAVTYSYFHTEAETVTPGSEDGISKFATIRSGTLAERMHLGSGLYAASKTDKGANNISWEDGFFDRVSFDNGSNYLTHFSSGAATLTIQDASSGGNAATATITANYERCGKTVTVWVEAVNIDTTGMTGANQIFITGLPFTCDANQPGSGTVILHGFAFPVNRAQATAKVVKNTTYMQIIATGAGQSDTPFLVSDVQASTSDIETLTVQYLAQ